MTHHEWFESMEDVLWKAMWQEGQQKAKEVPDQVQANGRDKRELITDIQDQVTREDCVNKAKAKANTFYNY